MAFDNVFGAPPPELAQLSDAARQFSPLSPGAERLDDARGLDNLALLAPPGAIERRATLALAPKDKGGGRLAKDLSDLGCACSETAKRHHRICLTQAGGDAEAIDAAIRAGAPRLSESLGLWTQPGVFSWDRIDPGTALLAAHLPDLSGRGADLGCGLGALAHRILASPRVKTLLMVDIDRRAIDLCARNVADARVRLAWEDVRRLPKPEPLDFVVMNPPFHDAGRENKGLGIAFIQRAAEFLRPGGVCWLVANRHLPYEAALDEKFRSIAPVAEGSGFKVIEAVK